MEDKSIKVITYWTIEGYYTALRWWNSLSIKERHEIELANKDVHFKNEQWKIYCLYWIGRK